MSESKGRGYSDSAVTIIFKGSSMAEVQGHLDDANSLADELRAVTLDRNTWKAAYENLLAETAELRKVPIP
jgi:hypothetical protein